MLLPELLLALVLAAPAETLLITGQVESMSSQHVVTPLTTNFQAKISYLVDEGERVEPGDVVARFDGTAVESQLRAAREELDQIVAQGERDVAQLRIAVAEAEIEFARAVVERDVAQMEAQVPAQFIGDLEYEENQLALERTENARGQSEQALAAARSRLDERLRGIDLEAGAKRERIARWERMLQSFEIVATQPGFVIHGSHPWMRNKFQVGDNVQTGWNVATVADDAVLHVVAWINEVDAPHVRAGTPVTVRFDAVPSLVVDAVLGTVSTAPEPKPDWGSGAYHRADVALSGVPAETLLPGMSALIEVPAHTDTMTAEVTP